MFSFYVKESRENVDSSLSSLSFDEIMMDNWIRVAGLRNNSLVKRDKLVCDCFK